MCLDERRAFHLVLKSAVAQREVTDPTALLSHPPTSDDLRVFQGRDDRSQVSRKDSLQGQSLAIMPPPAPSQVSSSSYRPSKSSRLTSSDRYEQQRLTWREEPAPSQIFWSSPRRPSPHRGSSEYKGRRVVMRSPPPPSLTSHSSSRRPDCYQGSYRDHYPSSSRRSSSSPCDSDDTFRPHTSSIVGRASRVSG